MKTIHRQPNPINARLSRSPHSPSTRQATSSSSYLRPLAALLVASLGIGLIGCEMSLPEDPLSGSGPQQEAPKKPLPFLNAEKISDYSPEEDADGLPLWALRQGAIVDLQGEWKLRDSYWGQYLALEPHPGLQPDAPANGMIFIDGEDAAALYQNLNVDIIKVGLRSTQEMTQKVREKRSHLAACVESEDMRSGTKTHRCALGINYHKGEFVAWPYTRATFAQPDRDHYGQRATLIQPRPQSPTRLAQGLLLIQLEGHEARLLFDNMDIEGQLTEAYWEQPPGVETTGAETTANKTFEMATEKSGPHLSCRRFSQLTESLSESSRGPALYQCFLEVPLMLYKLEEEPKPLMGSPRRE